MEGKDFTEALRAAEIRIYREALAWVDSKIDAARERGRAEAMAELEAELGYVRDQLNALNRSLVRAFGEGS